MDLSQELLVRGAAAGVFVALAGVIVVPPVSISRWSGALFSVAAAAHTITQLPGWQALLSIVAPLAWVLSVVAPGLFWAFAVTLFDDRKGPLPVLALPSLLLLVVGGVALILPTFAAVSWGAHNLAAAALFVHAMLLVWRGWRNDLVEARRRLRGVFWRRPCSTAWPWWACNFGNSSRLVAHHTKAHRVAMYAQLVGIIGITACLQWSLGGLFDSGFVLAWGFLGPIGALFFFPYRRAIPWFLLYLVTLLITVAFDGFFAARSAEARLGRRPCSSS